MTLFYFLFFKDFFCYPFIIFIIFSLGSGVGRTLVVIIYVVSCVECVHVCCFALDVVEVVAGFILFYFLWRLAGEWGSACVLGFGC